MAFSTKSKLLQLITIFFLLIFLTSMTMSGTFSTNNAHASIKTVPELPKKNSGRVKPILEKTLPPQAPPEKGKKNTADVPASVRKTVYLTFDDGPEKFSGDLIAMLDHFHAKATFFMLDGNIRKYPETVKRMVKDGQSVGLHGVTHDRKKFYASVGSVLSEMNQTRKTLKEITGIDSYLIRTPYGSAPDMKPAFKQAVYQNKYLLWDWNIDSMDWFYRDHRYVANVIAQLEKRKKQKGPLVILLHERKETLSQLPELLNYLSSQHYDCKALDSSMVPVHF